jgi:hypothetical protein
MGDGNGQGNKGVRIRYAGWDEWEGYVDDAGLSIMPRLGCGDASMGQNLGPIWVQSGSIKDFDRLFSNEKAFVLLR